MIFDDEKEYAPSLSEHSKREIGKCDIDERVDHWQHEGCECRNRQIFVVDRLADIFRRTGFERIRHLQGTRPSGSLEHVPEKWMPLFG